QPEPSGRALAATADRDLLRQVRAHARLLSAWGGLQVAAVEVPDALPGLHGGLGPVTGPVHLQEGVPGPVVEVELIGLAVRLERLLEFADLFRGRVRVLPAEQAEQRAGQ